MSKYKRFLIVEDNTGFAPRHMQFSYFLDDGELYMGSGETREDCEKQIDEIENN